MFLWNQGGVFSIEFTVIRWQSVRWSVDSKKERVAEEGGKKSRLFTNDTLPEFQIVQNLKIIRGRFATKPIGYVCSRGIHF